jgi:prepilin-type N-terminal cleavage/methylation domain-containing protein
MISGPLVWRRNAGFTLVEVSLAVLIVSLGLMTVFGLLPSALRMSDDAVTSTRDGLFAETMMAGLRANIALAPPESWTSIADLTVDACGNAIPGIGVISFDSRGMAVPKTAVQFP